jgi:hypothetical protein
MAAQTLAIIASIEALEALAGLQGGDECVGL